MSPSLRPWALFGLLLAATVPAVAQETPAASAAAPPGPSAEMLKKAKDVGLHPENRRGATVYCWEDAEVGTRFKTKKCVPESQLDELVARREAAQQNARQGNCAGSNCSH